jgi:predicted NBD/HSP70 family sugar kinase
MKSRPMKAKIKRALVAAVEAELLRKLRDQGPTSRVELARQMKLAPSTVGIYVRRLIADGFLTEGKLETRELGRPAVMLALNPAGGSFIGVDIEARNVYAVCVDFAQQTIKQVHRELRAAEATVDVVLERVEEAVDEVRVADRKLLGIGLGVPGSVDPGRGVAVRYEHIAGWNDVPVRDRLAARFDVPVHVENNIRSLAMAERWFGLGRGIENFLCVGIRSGIGVGMVVDGRLVRGATNAAGEAGRWPTGRHSPADRAAADDTLESHVAVSGLLRRFAAVNGTGEPTFADFAERIGRTDPQALQLLDDAVDRLGLYLAQANLLLNPERIILAGRLPELGDIVLQPLRTAVTALAPGYVERGPDLHVSSLGEFGGAVGAAALTVHEWQPTR